MKYKSKDDIPYFKFLAFSESIDGKSDEFTASETIKVFDPDSLEGFARALKSTKPVRSKYKTNFKFKNAGVFIDADTYFSDKDYREFFKLILKRRYFFKKINFDKISLAQAKGIIAEFSQFKSGLVSEYEYLYNPPIRSGGGMSDGNIARQAFSEHYGPYLEMVYVCMGGDFTKFEEVTGWDLHRFLFQAEYLIRKRDVEKMK